MASLSFPDVGIFLSGADPNDPNTVELWSPNIAGRTWRITNADRGKQYELDTSMPGRAALDIRNADEFLNPSNPSSPFLANAKPMRRIRMMYSYPPGGTGNLANTTAGIDPTVDSYTVGTLPAWLTNVGGVSGTVQAANPHSGANSMQYTVAGTTPPQGLSTVPLSCFPGNQYTASWFVRQSSASTQQIAVGGLTALDRFQRTGAWSGSAAELGGTWNFNGGVSGDFTTTAGPNPPGVGTASISNSSTNVFRRAILPLAAQDFDMRMLVTIPVVATGAAIVVGFEGRYVDANNHYRFELDCNTTGFLDVVVKKNVAGVLTTLATASSVASYAAGTQMWIRAQASGTTVQCKVWLAGTSEPAAWTATATDAALTAAGSVTVVNQLVTGNTNGTQVLSHQRFAVTWYSVVGTTTTTTAAYVRLTATFTATQPTHTFQVTTIGTAVAGTVNLDDFQLEPGNTANAFITTGPLIRGMWGGHVNELPITWVQGSQGFEGSVSAQCVGPLTALAKTLIHTDYVTAVLRKTPDYFWPLWDPSGTMTFAEVSGHNGPAALEVVVPTAFFGTNQPTTFSPATPNNIPGDPSGVGLTVTGPATSPGTSAVARVGTYTGAPAISFPTNNNYTMAAWISHTTTTANQTAMINTSTVSASGFQINYLNLIMQNTTPIQIEAQISFQGNGSQGLNLVATDIWGDGKPHLYVVTVNVVGATGFATMYVDGQQVANGSTAYSAGTPWAAQVLEIGGSLNLSGTIGAIPTQNGVYSHVALWNRALSAADVTDLWNAGNGNQGELSGTRVNRYLGNYYTGPSVVDSAPLSRMGSPTAPESTPLLQALQRVQDTEMGNLFENRDGAVQFDGREVRWQRLTPTVVFGDGPGEIPYTESPVFNVDTTQTCNQALITRTGGIRAVGRSDTTGSVYSFYGIGYTLGVDCQTDAEAQAHADWIVLTRSQPRTRVRTIRVEPGRNPGVFPALMNLEIGARVTVNRRPKAANSGAGMPPMSADYFVENISHNQVDPEQGTWAVDLQLSPVPTPQPWIVGHATYGVVGQTTRPGW